MEDKILERLSITITHDSRKKRGDAIPGYNNFIREFDIYEKKSYKEELECPICEEKVIVSVNSFKSATQLNKIGYAVIITPMIIYYLITVFGQLLYGDLSDYNILTYLILFIFPIIPAAILGGIIGMILYFILGELNIINDAGYRVTSKSRKHRANGIIIGKVV